MTGFSDARVPGFQRKATPLSTPAPAVTSAPPGAGEAAVSVGSSPDVRPSAPRPDRRPAAATTPPRRNAGVTDRAADALPAPAEPAKTRRRSWLPGSFLARVLFLASIPPVALCAAGVAYYVLPLEERPWSPLHEWFRPTGYVGQSMGFFALFLFLFLWLLPIRKRVKWLKFPGPAPRWLDVHIVAGLLVPFVGAVHAAWRFNGLIGLGYFSMLVVSMSGVVGRYLYAHIPRRRNGLELSREEAAAERRALIGRLVERTGIPLEHVVDLLQTSQAPDRRLGILPTLRRMAKDDLIRRRAARSLVAEWKKRLPRGEKPDRRALREMRRAARHEMALAQQIRLLDATHRVFRLWHVAHLPFAIVAFLAVLIHVAIAVAFGATWLT